MYPKKSGELVRVIHRVNQKIVVTECESVRGSNIAGYIDLLRVRKSGIEGLFKKDESSRKIESLCLPTLSVIAICYVEKRDRKNFVSIRGAERD
ncbi:MAG: hypothetical protein L0Y68_05250 [Candidatus Dadabacteria bacterium]|nr:hypothetical protein [Candidatus Dadabacteria bacterium]